MSFSLLSLLKGVSPYDFGEQSELTASPQQELLDSLCELYSVLKEEDYWVGMWQKRARYPETVTALAFQQQGMFEKAQTAFEAGETVLSASHKKPVLVYSHAHLYF